MKEVRLTDQDGEQLGIVSIQEALAKAEEAELDLVEISPNAEPPVKEIKFRPGTDEGDYQVKLRSILRFLEDGDKVKITVRYRGREMAHQEIGLDVLERVKQDTAEVAVVESAPGKLEGRQVVMVIAPKKK